MSVKYFGSDALNKLIDLVKTALGLKADDSNVVHKTGDETVGGGKTFNNSMTVISSEGGTTPFKIRPGSGGTEAWMQFQNGSGSGLGYIGVKNDKKPYFYDSSAKRLALISETMPVFSSNDVSSNDCNTWTAKGVYQGLDVTNSPVTGWITVVTIPAGNENYNYCEQRLFVTASNNTYSRYRMNGTWGSWKRIPLSDEVMPYFYKYVSGETHNCNDWTDQGIYVDYNVTNAPLTGWVTIITLLAGYPRQICYPYLSDKVYCRYKNSSTWSAWHHSGVNYGTDPDYCGNLATMKNTGTWEDGINISQGITETSGIHMDGAGIKMWSPCDNGSLIYYDEDNGNEVWRVDDTGCLVGGMADPSATSNKVWFGKDSNGKWGYKTSKTGTVTPFRNPTGNATASDVRSGKTFSNASGDGLTGTWDVALANYSPSNQSVNSLSVYASSSKTINVPNNCFIAIVWNYSNVEISMDSGTGFLMTRRASSTPFLMIFESTSSDFNIKVTYNGSGSAVVYYTIIYFN